MAGTILDARGWECGNSMLNTVDTSSLFYFTVSGNHKTGTYGLRCGGDGGEWARWAISGTPANPSTSVWVYAANVYSSDGTGVNGLNLRYRLDTGEYVELRWKAATRTFDAYVNGGLVASGTIEVSVNTWFHVQFYVVIADAGSINVKIDGHESINYSGDTNPSTASGVTYLYAYGGLSGSKYFYIDDLVWGSGGYLGDLRCLDIRPNADTAQDDWTPSAGADNYAMVDETPENDAEYNETNTNGHADELALEDFDDTLVTPRAVVAYARARMEGAFGDSLKVGIVSNAVEVTTTHALSTAYEYYTHIADEDPNGPIAWTDAAVDALLLRYEAVIA